jgi:hypothetical protein
MVRGLQRQDDSPIYSRLPDRLRALSLNPRPARYCLIRAMVSAGKTKLLAKDFNRPSVSESTCLTRTPHP